MTTSERIRQARKAAGLTQEQLAKKLGVKHSVISKYECGRVVNLKRDKISEIANALNVRPSWLMCMEDEKENQSTTGELDQNSIQLLEAFKSLSKEQQRMIIAQLQGLTQLQKDQGD